MLHNMQRRYNCTTAALKVRDTSTNLTPIICGGFGKRCPSTDCLELGVSYIGRALIICIIVVAVREILGQIFPKLHNLAQI